MKKITLLLCLLSQFSLSSVYAASPHEGHGMHHNMKGHQQHMTESHHKSSAGQPGALENVDKIVSINMYDAMRYSLQEFDVRPGQTVHFKITNKGKIPHEFTIGNKKELLDHRDMMRQMPNMVHREANAITLKPGESGEILWTFGHSDETEVACLIPGHYEAGMKIKINVNHS